MRARDAVLHGRRGYVPAPTAAARSRRQQDVRRRALQHVPGRRPTASRRRLVDRLRRVRRAVAAALVEPRHVRPHAVRAAHQGPGLLALRGHGEARALLDGACAGTPALARTGCARERSSHTPIPQGNHRYPHGFSGDTFQHEVALYWEVKTTQTAANVLWGYLSHDIGGFHDGNGAPGDATPSNRTGAELLLRWIQFGAVTRPTT